MLTGLVQAVVPALLTVAGNGNKVLAGAARECLPTLFEHCHFDGMLKATPAPPRLTPPQM